MPQLAEAVHIMSFVTIL